MLAAVNLNTLKALTSLQSRRNVHQKFTSFCFYVLTCFKEDQMVAKCLDVQIKQTRILI